MRVTNGMLLDMLAAEVFRVSEKLLKTQEALSSGRKVNRPSDDPVATSGIVGYNKIISGLEQYKRNIGFAGDYLTNSETTLSGVTDMLSRLKELAVGQATATASAETRRNAAYEVEKLYDGLIAIGNTRIGDRYLFSGYLATTEPFDPVGNYSGDSNETVLNIGPGVSFAYGLTGDRIFKGAGFTNGVDIYGIIQNLKVALQTDNVTEIKNAVGRLDDSIGQISNITADIGARLNRLDSQEKWIDGFTTETKVLLSGIEDADLAVVSINLAKQRTTLEALGLTALKVSELNIFNFLR